MSDVRSLDIKTLTHKKKSVIGTGKQTVDFIVGAGLFELLSATIWTEKAYAVPGEIAFNHKLDDGTYQGTGFCHGWISHLNGLDIVAARVVEGPGYFTALIRNLEADAIVWFEIVYRGVNA